MDKLDQKIMQALEDEERQILEAIGKEQSFPKQAIGLFRGNLVWLNGVILLFHVLLTVGGVYAAWRFFGMTDVLEAMRWGLSAGVLLLAALITRLTLLRSMQTNQVLFAVKELKMQVALLASKH
jgi:hypothetical protein